MNRMQLQRPKEGRRIVCCKVYTLSRPMLSSREGQRRMREGEMGVGRGRREWGGGRGTRDGKEIGGEEEEGQTKRKGERIGGRGKKGKRAERQREYEPALNGNSVICHFKYSNAFKVIIFNFYTDCHTIQCETNAFGSNIDCCLGVPVMTRYANM